MSHTMAKGMTSVLSVFFASNPHICSFASGFSGNKEKKDQRPKQTISCRAISNSVYLFNNIVLS
jgi:hypothetical protein